MINNYVIHLITPFSNYHYINKLLQIEINYSALEQHTTLLISLMLYAKDSDITEVQLFVTH